MDLIEDPLAPVIEEIATLLATGYLRLRIARTASEVRRFSSAPGVGEFDLYSAGCSLPGRRAFNNRSERKLILNRTLRMETDALVRKAAGQLRCAIYTRKSTDEGLDQEFNSLDAQREAAEAFIRQPA